MIKMNEEKTITARRAFEIIQMNRNGIKPEALVDNEQETEPVATDLLSQDNINRFDSKNPKRKKGQNKKQNRPAGDNQGAAATGDKKGNAKNDNKRQDGKRQDRKQNNKQDLSEPEWEWQWEWQLRRHILRQFLIKKAIL